VTDDAQPDLLSIGSFADRTRLSRKALRIYDRSGLLRPAEVDPDTGYRRYRPGQVPAGRLIGLLRGAGLGLAEIGPLFADAAGDPSAAIARLEDAIRAGERELATRTALIRHIQTILRQEEDPMFPVHTRHVPARRLMSIQRRLHGTETDAVAAEARAAFAGHLGGAAPGPFTLIFHGTVDAEHDGPLEAVQACPADTEPSEIVGIRTEPAHDEAYTTITKAQWAYPAILAAYDAVAASAPVAGRSRARLSCREVYLAATDPALLGEDDLVCDIAFPLGERTSGE
jgi:DNA-binding transcriptional MerR regulator